MRLFIDTGSVAEVEEIAAWGVLSGATTNPSLLAKEEGDPGEIIKRICELVRGPVSAEVVSQDPQGMVDEGRALRELHEHVTVKIPFCEPGLAATRALTGDGSHRLGFAKLAGGQDPEPAPAQEHVGNAARLLEPGRDHGLGQQVWAIADDRLAQLGAVRGEVEDGPGGVSVAKSELVA